MQKHYIYAKKKSDKILHCNAPHIFAAKNTEILSFMGTRRLNKPFTNDALNNRALASKQEVVSLGKSEYTFILRQHDSLHGK